MPHCFAGVEGHRAGPSAGFTALLVLYTGVNEIGRVYVKRKKNHIVGCNFASLYLCLWQEFSLTLQI